MTILGRCAATDCPTNSRGLCDPCRRAGDEPHPYVCPTCGGNGCRICGHTGELVEWTR